MPSARWLLASTVVALTVLAVNASAADEPSHQRQAMELFPPSTLAYIELNRPGDLVRLVESSFWQRIASTPQYQAAWQTSQAQQGKMLVSFLEQQLGTSWPQAVRTLTDGGLYLAFDAGTQGAALLVKTSDPAMRQKLIDVLIEMNRGEAAGKGLPDPVQPADYRGFTGYKIAQGGLISFGPWLLVTNKEPLARWVIDSYVTDGRTSLATDAMFKAARDKAEPGLPGWAYARIGTLRAVGVGRELFAGRSKNPAAELFAGGVIDALSKADYLTAELRAGAQGVKLSILAPYDPATVAPARRFFFAPAGEGSAPEPLKPAGTLLTFTAYRDLGAMWLAAPDLFDDNIATQLAQTDSGLSNFFSGQSFSQDILSQIEPRFQFLIARQEFKPGAAPVPAIKLPAFAMVFRVKDPQVMKPYMQVAFQTAVSIGNIQATMQGGPTLMITNETRDDLSLSSAGYLTMADEKAMTDAPIYHNFTPSMATVADYVIITSTRDLAEKLAALAADPSATTTSADNALLEIDGAAVLAAMRDNRAQLIAQHMIRNGADKVDAEQGVDLLLQAMSYLGGAQMKLAATDGDPDAPGAPGMLRLDLGATFNDPERATQ